MMFACLATATVPPTYSLAYNYNCHSATLFVFISTYKIIITTYIWIILLQPTTVNAKSYYTRPSRAHRPKFTYCRFDWQYINLHFGLRPPEKSRWLSPSLPPLGPRYALETHPDPS